MQNFEQEHRFAAGYAKLVLKLRWPIILLLVIATAIMATQVPKLDVRNDPDTLLPPSNRYVATNLYAEHNFGMGNIMVVALRVKEGDIYQPWFINMVQAIHNRLVDLPESRPENFIDIAAQKIKYMSADENGLVFKRLIPTDGISTTDPQLAEEQLAFLKEGIKTNPVMAPMLVSMWGPDGERCAFEDYDKDECVAKAAYIIGDYTDEVKPIYLPWVREVRKLMEEFGAEDRAELLVAGEPYFLAYMLLDLVNKWWLFAISLGIVLVILWLEFRDWRGALFPLLGVGMTIVYTLGLMGFTQFKLTTMMVLTPMLLLAIGIGHSVQVTRRFLLEQGRTGDCNKAAEVAIGHTIVPATLSIITDMVGFATLATVDISFYKDYAYFGVFGMLTLLATTTTLIPLLMSVMPPSQEKCSAGGHGWETAVGGLMTRIITGPMKIIPILVVAGVMAWAAFYALGFYDPARKVTAENPLPGVERGINYARAAFKGSSETWRQLEELNRIMPGVISVSIPIRGKDKTVLPCVDELFTEEIYELETAEEKAALCASEKAAKGCWDAEACGPQGVFNKSALLKDMIDMETWMRQHPFIGYTGSYAQYVALVNMLLAAEPGEAPSIDDLLIPTQEYLLSINPDDDRNADKIVEMYNGLLEIMTSAGDMDSFVAPDWNEGVIMGFINTMDPVETHQVTMDIQQYIEEHKNDEGFKLVNFGLRSGPVGDLSGDTNELSVDGPNYVRPAVGGFLGATEATREVAETEYLRSPLQTAVAVFLMGALIFRSFLVSALLTFLLMITLFAQYGLGGYYTSVQEWSGNLAFHLLVTLSISLGLGVDYGIYMISRLREEMQATAGNWSESLRNTLNTTGSAVIVSVVVLLGSFIPLVGTDLANTWGLAMYIGQALIIDVFTALLILPMLVYLFRLRYVFRPAD